MDKIEKSTKLSYSLFLLIFLSQGLAIKYFERTNKFDWGAETNKKHVIWMYNHAPDWYNPDPTIFIARTHNGFARAAEKEILVNYNKQGQIVKIMVHRDKMDLLKDFGFSTAEIENYSKNLTFVLGWAYINDIKNNVDPEVEKKIISRIREEKITAILNQIKSTPDWYAKIKQEAEKNQLPIDSVMYENAVYCINQEP